MAPKYALQAVENMLRDITKSNRPFGDVLHLNECILSRLEEEEVVYYSVDSHIDDESNSSNNPIPVEYLNSITPDGLPPHKLRLKVGCIIMLLRNMNLVQGLCNGTRLVVRRLLKNVICAEIISGKFKGEKVLIPRIDLSPSEDLFPFKMVRRQFPVRLAYAMTINKSQGQSFDKVGLFLPSSAFGHGQIYVGFSRVRSKDNLKVYATDSAVFNNPEFPQKLYIKNIVYPEVL
ncbi:ATP-dependent DNA helicase PIF1-like [Leptopilina boulardi]|uniref:ATP-dependent DNA helicase PIF1-like n=1 Tax=Leptopilina boulardi TaxID=63433 RepID=UPI0021F66929|nr:ATP-dependent DNA helicase PIF1-like [Leptopilina boulardi]